MLIKNHLKKLLTPLIKEFFQSKNLSEENHLEIKIQVADAKFGDFTTNIAMESAKLLKSNPREVANSIKKMIDEHLVENEFKDNFLKKVEVAGPGFINLYLSSSFQKKVLKEILERTQLSELKDFHQSLRPNRKVLLEYVSANPTGPLHVGHGRWAVIGSVLAKILRSAGDQVYEEFYINDAGKQIELLNESVAAARDQKTAPEGGYQGEYIKDLAKLNIDPVEYFLKEHQQVLNSMNTHIENFFSERKLRESGEVDKIIDTLKKNDLIYFEDQAWWFRSSLAGDDKDRVIIRSDGELTYFGVDIAYHFSKFQRGYSLLIDVLGADHHGYVKRIQSAVEVSSQKKARLEVIVGQLVSVLRHGTPVRMSKRSGDIIELKDVIDEIGVDAIRYFFSMRSPNTPLEFDLEIAKQKNLENPVFYIQYCHARIQSVLNKAKEQDIIPIEDLTKFDFSLIENHTNRKILNHLLLFEEELLLIIENYEIQHLNNYLHELSSLFHSYYNQEIFVSNKNLEDKEISAHRLTFLLAIDKVIQEGLTLLGISFPDTM